MRATRDAARAAGRVLGPFHGVPIVLKDNIDATELPTTGGALALVDHRPRLDSRVAAGHEGRAARSILGKANLDEFPFGDFGISTVGGTVGNAYDPSLSTAGSSGGSATAVATSLAALGFGTDTCNSLSNPRGFASLATIRTTRGLTSRAGVMPLNTYNDAVGPMGRSVRDIALALDLVTGADPSDPVTLEATAHAGPSFVANLDAASLKGARIGVFRQRFVGITGEREVAETMDRVVKELRAAGRHGGGRRGRRLRRQVPRRPRQRARIAAGRLDGVSVARRRTGRSGDHGRGAGRARARWRRAASAGSRTRWGRCRRAPALEAATREFVARREAFRKVLVDALEAQQLDALLYPANQARPHTHEGGAERYGTEPGTCEESAATGLPQVTVPAGYLGGRYPVGISFLGRMWDDRRLLAIAYAYEQATRHRRPPATVR